MSISLLRLRLLCLGLPLLLSACALPTPLTTGGIALPKPFEYTYDQTHAFAPAQVIRIRSEDAEVTVTGADRPDVRVRAEYRIASSAQMLEKFSYQVEVVSAPTELRVTEIRRTGTRDFKYDQQAHRIQIEVPRNAHVQITEEDGTCIVTRLAGPVEMTLDDGRARATDCSGPITVTLDQGTFTHDRCTGPVSVKKR